MPGRNTYRPMRIIACFVVMLSFVRINLSAQYNEELLKAAYIERISRFIEWPSSEGVRDTSIFVIGVYNEKTFLNSLSEVFKVKTIKNKKVKIMEITNPGQIKNCDICYISGRERQNIKNLVTLANKNGVLIMSEANDFGAVGVHINFYIEDEKLKFEINKTSVDSGKLKISSLLMKSSRII